MQAGRGIAVATAALLAALVATGCGLGPGEDVGAVRLTVTHEFGARRVLEKEVGDVRESATVMRVLEGAAEIGTRYGGGFVQSIDGTEGAQRGGRFYDWFYSVDGVEASVGAADYSLQGGDRIWWDYHDWTAVSRIPAVVGSFPAPLAGGYDGEEHPVSLLCEGGGDACGIARRRLQGAGVKLTAGSPPGAIRVLVGPWRRLRSDPAAGLLASGPVESGVFARFEGTGAGARLQGLDPAGEEGRAFGRRAGLVAATRRYEAPPTWLVTGATGSGVRAAAAALDEAKLRDHYAVAVEDGKETPLPVGTR